jgi:hypothetical protein
MNGCELTYRFDLDNNTSPHKKVQFYAAIQDPALVVYWYGNLALNENLPQPEPIVLCTSIAAPMTAWESANDDPFVPFVPSW